MNNNQKRQFHTDSVVSTDQVFTLLDTVQNDNQYETEELMNDFDTESIAPEEVTLTGNPSNKSALKLEANVHVVDQEITH